MVSTFELTGHVIGLIINRDLTDTILDEIIAEIEEKTSIHDTINVFIELEKERDVTLKAVLKGIKYKYSNAEKFNKIAIVTDVNWFQTAVDLSDILLDAEVQTFDIQDRLEAIQWISL